MEHPKIKQFVTGYWVFQANPKYYDIVAALKAIEPEKWNWMANQHFKKGEIRVGDKVIIWVCGQKKPRGVYALATVTDEVSEFADTSDPYYVDSSKAKIRPRVRLHMEPCKPILEDEIALMDALKDMPHNFYGTNRKADRRHFEAISALFQPL